MTNTTDAPDNLFVAMWRSWLTSPTWVMAWVLLILAPTNIASLFFLGEPSGLLVAALALGGMTITTITLILERGFSRLAGAGHVIAWTPLVLMLVFAKPEGSAAYGTYLTILLMVNLISLVFDFEDGWKWLRGDRAVQYKKS